MGRRNHDERWAGFDLGVDLAHRGVGPEVDDPPAAAVQDDPEDHRSQVVQLVRRAGDDGDRSAAGGPASGQAGEAAAQDLAGEVLLDERDLAALPPIALLLEVGHDDIAQDGSEGVLGDEPVEHVMPALLIEVVEAAGQERAVAVERGRPSCWRARARSCGCTRGSGCTRTRGRARGPGWGSRLGARGLVDIARASRRSRGGRGARRVCGAAGRHTGWCGGGEGAGRGAEPPVRAGLCLGGRHAQHDGLVVLGAQHDLGGFGGREAGREQLDHVPDAALIIERVEPETAGRPVRTQQPVAGFPRAQGVVAEADPAAQLADPHQALGKVGFLGRRVGGSLAPYAVGQPVGGAVEAGVARGPGGRSGGARRLLRSL